MIKNARALRTDLPPQNLKHRGGKLQELSRALAPIEHGEPGMDACIFGPSGTGKTALAWTLLGELEQKTLGVLTGYVNCISRSSKASALYALLDDIGRAADLRRKGTPADVYLDRLRDLDEQVVAVIDEVHTLDPDTLLALESIENVTTIPITTREDEWFARTNERVASRYRVGPNVTLEPYTHTEMVSIIQARADVGLVNGAVSSGAIEEAATIAGGDARMGITLLRQAAMAADGTDRRITADLIGDVESNARTEIVEELVRDLSTPKRLLFEIVLEERELESSDLAEKYREQSCDPVSASTRHRYLQSLIEYELIEKRGETRGTTYRVTDRVLQALPTRV